MSTRFYFVVLGIALSVLVSSNLYLAWDGAYQLVNLLERQAPLVANARYAKVPLYWLVLATSQITDDLNILTKLYSALHALVPFLRLIAAWQLLKDSSKTQRLFVWAAFSVNLAALPVFACSTCESVLALPLFWLMLSAVLVGMPDKVVPLVLVLSIVILFLHPTSIILFAIGALACFLMALRKRTQRRRLLLTGLAFLAFMGAALLRLQFFQTPYERDQFSIQVLQQHFKLGLAGIVLGALLLIWLAGVGVLLGNVIAPFHAQRLHHTVQFLAHMLLGSAGLLLAYWAIYPQNWSHADSYRVFAVFVSLPFFLAAIWEAIIADSSMLSKTEWEFRQLVLNWIAIIFCIVLTIQSVVWLQLSHHFLSSVLSARTACISTDELSQIQNTALDNWAITSYATLLQSRDTEKLILHRTPCNAIAVEDGLPLAVYASHDWDVLSWEDGWFRKIKLRSALSLSKASCTFPLSRGWQWYEKNETSWWRWTAGKATMTINAHHAQTVHLNAVLFSSHAGDEISISLNRIPFTRVRLSENEYRNLDSQLNLHMGKNELTFQSDTPPLQLDLGKRTIAFAVSNLKVTSAQGIICQ